VTITRRWTTSGEPTTSLYHVHVMPGGEVAAPVRLGSRKAADQVAAPVRHRTKANEREDPPTPGATAPGGLGLPGHDGSHRNCRACGTSVRQLAALASVPPPKPTWCGVCDEHTRTLEVETPGSAHTTVKRCPTCHPMENR
jgi:hypothetical protein